MRLIDADKILEELNKLLYLTDDEPESEWDYRRGIRYAINTVELAPTSIAEEKIREWQTRIRDMIEQTDKALNGLPDEEESAWLAGKYVYSCSNCGYMVETPSPYCPNCGRHMKGEYK